jgi:RNA 3'-terminal phosphate cyclase
MVGMSPTVQALERVLFPILSKMGANIEMSVVKHGFFPDVVGEA